MKLAFVTDSTADIPPDLASRHAIEVVPALINMHGRSYVDGIDLSREEFYTRLPSLKPPPTTAAPSVGNFGTVYEKLLRGGAGHILSIHAANQLSGIFNAARLAANEFKERVSVFDSGQLSLGIGFQVILAAEAAGRGALLEEVTRLVHEVQKRVRVAALLQTLEYIRRSGRVSWAKAMLGTLLHLQPLVEVRHGLVHRLGQARTRAQGISRLTEALDTWGALERLAILHTNAEEAAHHLLDRVRSRVSVAPLIVNVTTAIGTHVGPNGLGFAAVPRL